MTPGQLSYRDAAVEAARWVEAQGRPTADGIGWPHLPQDDAVNPTIFNGTAGVVLGLLEVWAATGDDRWLRLAAAGGNELAGTFEQVQASGLYVGLAGVAFALAELGAVTQDDKHRGAAGAAVDVLAERALPAGSGVAWNDVTDIISGGAGIGLFMSWVAARSGDAGALELAVAAARRLVELAVPAEAGGLSWSMSPAASRLLPNFSHGTAGVGYFLATLYEQTGADWLRAAAVAAGEHLVALADPTSGLVCHAIPGGETLHYLGWCHGPVGTARLYHRLASITGSAQWAAHREQCQQTLLDSGLPSRQTGLWDNVGQCCGSAGVAEFFGHAYLRTGQVRHLAFARRLTDDLLARATRDATGLHWSHAEHRIHPDQRAAQPGYQHGAAGILAWLSRLDSLTSGQARAWHMLPDCPFPGPRG